MATSGSLKIVIFEARLTRETDIFSKINTYASLQTGLQTFKTRISQGAGKTPKWDQAFDIDLNNLGNDANVRVYDEDVTTNDLVSIRHLNNCFPLGWRGHFKVVVLLY